MRRVPSMDNETLPRGQPSHPFSAHTYTLVHAPDNNNAKTERFSHARSEIVS